MCAQYFFGDGEDGGDDGSGGDDDKEGGGGDGEELDVRTPAALFLLRAAGVAA